ncbi:MAG: hypothetical protein QM755_10670 [Luteolibacter sp.]
MKPILVFLLVSLPALCLSQPAEGGGARLMASLLRDVESLRDEVPLPEERLRHLAYLISDLNQSNAEAPSEILPLASRAIALGSHQTGDVALELLRTAIARAPEERKAQITRATTETTSASREVATRILNAKRFPDLSQIEVEIDRLKNPLRVVRVNQGAAWRDVDDLQWFTEIWKRYLSDRQAGRLPNAISSLTLLTRIPERIPDCIGQERAMREIAAARLACGELADPELLERISGIMERAMAATHPQEIAPLLAEATRLPASIYPQPLYRLHPPRESLISVLENIREALTLMEQGEPRSTIEHMVSQTGLPYGEPLFGEINIPRTKLRRWFNSFATPRQAPADLNH